MSSTWQQSEQYFGKDNLQTLGNIANQFINFIATSQTDKNFEKTYNNICKMYKQTVDRISAQIEEQNNIVL